MQRRLRNITMRLLLVAGGAFAAAPATADEKSVVISPDSASLEWGPCPTFMPDSCRIAVLHGNPAEANADVLFKLASKTAVPSHWHSSAERMVLISGKMRVEYDGQPPATLEAGDYAYGPPELPHVAYCESDADCVLFIAFVEPVDALETE